MNEERRRPNVIIFLPEDMGYGDLGHHGNPDIKTPNMDAFARESLELGRFYVSPVCSPSRASYMTGRHNFRTGVTDVFPGRCEMRLNELTLADMFKEAGYATGLFGKWHLGEDGDYSPTKRGFDEVLTFRGIGLDQDQYLNPTLLENGVPTKKQGYCMDVFTDAAIDFIKRNHEKPFFVYLPSNLLHTPLVAPESDLALYEGSALGESTRISYAMASNVDTNFGRLRDILRTLEIESNTILMIASDHGPCTGSMPVDRYNAGLHGLKGTVYENGIHVSCFIRWPEGGVSEGRKDTTLCAHVDVVPTLLEACQITPRDKLQMDGISFLPLLRGETVDTANRHIMLQWDSGKEPRRYHSACIVTRRWKLVMPVGMDAPEQQHARDYYKFLCMHQGRGERSLEGKQRFELFDLLDDPGEWRNVASEHPEIVAELRASYDNWFDEVTKDA